MSYFGVGVRSNPAYDGSPVQRVSLIPVVRYYRGAVFVRTTQGVFEGGGRINVSRGLAFGVQLAYESGRRARERDILNPDDHSSVPGSLVRGTSPAPTPNYDLGAGASIGTHLEFDKEVGPVPINLLGRIRQNVDFDRGAQLDLRFTSGIYGNQRIRIGIFAQETWANAKSSDTYYGITEVQPGSVFPAFDARSGRLFTGAGFIGSIDVIPELLLVWSAEHRRLHGDAAHSPLVRRTSNQYFSIGVARRF
jgi:outer membrane scaffolding protein for murein synthesis (MipA/OmpV family)